MAAKKKGEKQDTPAMRQYRRFKEQHPDCVLFFRMGDFYEMFYEDAVLAHKVLGVTLTERTSGIPMSGVPYHSVEGYLRRMIQAGHRVAVCEQTEDAAQAKGVVQRDVTRVITPGTLTDESLLEEGTANYLAAVLPINDQRVSVAWVELSTGAFSLAEFDTDVLADELARIAPRELLYPEQDKIEERTGELQVIADSVGLVLSPRPGWQFRHAEAFETLCRQFEVQGLTGFGLDDNDPAIGPAGALVHYLLETQRTETGGQRDRLPHLQAPRRFQRADHLVIDQTSLRALEIDATMRTGQIQGSLLGVLQACVTAMGKRTLRQWLCYPLAQRGPIEARQRVVGALVEDEFFLDQLREALDQVHDVQRISGRIAVGRATPRDLVGLGRSAGQVTRLAELTGERPAVAEYHDRLAGIAGALGKLADTIDKACIEAPPAHMRDGGLIRDGFDAQLDETRSLERDSNVWLAKYQKELVEATGIQTLKVGYNKVFGYYIEVTAAHRDKAPDAWTRKQTLKNAERFITPQLKEYEDKVLSASTRSVQREQALFAELCDEAQRHLPQLHALAETVAELDVLGCFAKRAKRYRYVKPTMVETPMLDIDAGRHPVLDELLADQFVPNDVRLGCGNSVETVSDAVSGAAGGDGEEAKPVSDTVSAASGGRTLALITGPNMAGKSTYIRQTALITLLAHTGSFVPAERAVIGMTDRIFTRIGASDELHAGQSTFMVEMTETSNICHHATPRSLVVLDEIGRGTSTLDGLSLAWAIAEHLAGRQCRTLFATHYHELTSLAEQLDTVTNLNVTVREWQDQIVFLHRIVPGATDRSYGIHVAKLAGMPDPVVTRANELLKQLAVRHEDESFVPAAAAATQGKPRKPAGDGQMSLFTEYVAHPVVEQLDKLSLDEMTPMQAFDTLRQLKAAVSE